MPRQAGEDTPKRRGRPPGSKNKAKVPSVYSPTGAPAGTPFPSPSPSVRGRRMFRPREAKDFGPRLALQIGQPVAPAAAPTLHAPGPLPATPPGQPLVGHQPSGCTWLHINSWPCYSLFGMRRCLTSPSCLSHTNSPMPVTRNPFSDKDIVHIYYYVAHAEFLVWVDHSPEAVSDWF